MMDFRVHGDDLNVGGQIDVSQVEALAAKGFRTLICNRPDAEDGAVPSSVIGAAARALGMVFIDQPVLFSTLDLDDGNRFMAALEDAPHPVFAYCRTGRRSAALWVFGRAPDLGVEAALAISKASGADLDELRPRLVAAGLK